MNVRLLYSRTVLCSPSARAQQPVSFPSGDATAQGLLYLPQGAGPHPALIVIHEWWGLNDWIKQEAAGYAAKGYVALAVDLYRGKVATTPDLAHELSRGLPQDQGVRDLTRPTCLPQPQGREARPHRRGGLVHGRRLSPCNWPLPRPRSRPSPSTMAR